MINPMELTGKHVLITGGSSGIGRACAIQASRLGAKVTIIARNEDKLKETLFLMDNEKEHAYYLKDLSDISSIENLVKTIVLERGSIDGFVHAAGIGNPRMLKDSKYSYVNKMFKIHTFAFIEIVRCLWLKDNLNEFASLVGISSVAAEKGNKSQNIYAAAKGAMNSFVRPAALELSKRHIRINTVGFAMVDTDMYQEFLDTGGDIKVMEKQCLGLIDVENAANNIMYLLSDTSKYITAANLPVYAGW